jgi:hypothetical protein
LKNLFDCLTRPVDHTESESAEKRKSISVIAIGRENPRVRQRDVKKVAETRKPQLLSFYPSDRNAPMNQQIAPEPLLTDRLRQSELQVIDDESYLVKIPSDLPNSCSTHRPAQNTDSDKRFRNKTGKGFK